MSAYTESVKQAVCKLLDIAYSERDAFLIMDTDADEPDVQLWVSGKCYSSCEQESFLDCCEAVLKAYEESKQSIAAGERQ